MDKKFTNSIIRTFVVVFVAVISTLDIAGQTTTNVSVANFSFTPQTVTITAGDKVVWTNNGGTHNVDGKMSTFPANPESFGNSVGSGWTYEFTFNTAGTYNYQCDPHAGFGMTGVVIVNPKSVTAVPLLSDNKGVKIQVYPNPVSDYLELLLPANYPSISSLKVYSINGSLISEKAYAGNTEIIRYDVSQLTKGLYLLEVNASVQKQVIKFLKQ